jgi:hypothetical protein
MVSNIITRTSHGGVDGPGGGLDTQRALLRRTEIWVPGSHKTGREHADPLHQRRHICPSSLFAVESSGKDRRHQAWLVRRAEK